MSAIKPGKYFIISKIQGTNSTVIAAGLEKASTSGTTIITKSLMKGDKSLLWDFQLANEGTGDHQTMIIQHVETGFAMAPSAREGGAPVIAVIKGTGSTDTTSPPTIYWQVTPHAFEPPSYGPYGLSKIRAIGQAHVLDLLNSSTASGTMLVASKDKEFNSANDGHYNQAWNLMPLAAV